MDFTLKLNPKTRDLCFDDAGIMETIEGDNGTIQNVNVNLNTRQGEFILDETHGTPYGRIMGRASREVMPGESEMIIREGVLQEPKVALVQEVNVELPPDRTLHADIAGELASGGSLETEVIYKCKIQMTGG